MSDEEKHEKEAEEPRESNPDSIDPDKVAENPHSLPYAHTVGGAEIKPVDKGKGKGACHVGNVRSNGYGPGANPTTNGAPRPPGQRYSGSGKNIGADLYG